MTARSKTIGVLINGLDQPYQQSVWDGVREAARSFDVNVFFLNTGRIESALHQERMRNYLHRFIGAHAVDGVFVVATTITSYSGPAALTETFKDLFSRVPVVTVGMPYPGFSSIAVDNRAGLREVVRHLVEAHGRRRFVFIAGYPENTDGNERLAAFLDALAEYGLGPVDPVPVAGNFNYETAIRAFRAWLDRGIPFDAVVAANDESAFACYDAMRERGIKVPRDVSLTGFDDIVNTRFFEVPLTTVRQPMVEVASRAIALLVGMIDGSVTPKNLVLPTTAVFRQSCGCLSGAMRCSTASDGSESLDEYADAFRGHGETLRALEASFAVLREEPSARGDFLRDFQSFLLDVPPGPRGLYALEAFVSGLERSFPSGVQGHESCEAAINEAHALIMQKAESYQANRAIMKAHLNRRTQYSIGRLMTSFSLDRLLVGIEELLPDVGLRSCFISLFVPKTGNKRSRLVFAYRDGKRLSLPSGGILFATERFVPEEVLDADRRFSLFIDILFHEETLLGILAIDIDREADSWSDSVTSQLRSALRASLLLDELVAKDERLNAAFSEISERAIELERANVRIREDQERLLISEKMASLGRLTAGIAHEMNTPLAAVRASLSEIGKLLEEYRASAGDPDVTRDDHLAIADEMARSLAIASRSAERAAFFIRSVKAQTRASDDSVPNLAFDVASAVSDALALLAHEFRRGKCRVDFVPPRSAMTVFGKQERFIQVVTNLVVNAIEAMAPAGGTVSVVLSSADGNAVLVVSDTGMGMEEATVRRIFEPLFTTKPFGVGTGLGLAIVHDIITGDFRGAIDVESAPGKGSSFTATIPLFKETSHVAKIP